MGCNIFSIDVRLCEMLARRLGIRRFVETGTFQGDTVASIQSFFDDIETVELSVELHEAALKRFCDSRRVRCSTGASPDFLRRVTKEHGGQPMMFWLDAHWCNATGASGESAPCPLLEELDSLGVLNAKSVVWVDDLRYFLSPPPFPLSRIGWPSFDEVVRRVIRLAGNTHRVACGNDTLLVVPNSIHDLVQSYFHHYGSDGLVMAQKARSWEIRFPGALSVEQAADGDEVETLHLRGVLKDGVSRDLRGRLEDLSSYVVRSLASSLCRRFRSLGKWKWLDEWRRVPSIDAKDYQFVSRFDWMTLGKCYQYEPRNILWEQLPEQGDDGLPSVSIVTPSFNQGAFVQRTVLSVLEQATPGMQYILQDGGSTDSTLEVLEPLHSRFYRFVSGRDAGQAAAIREGFEASDGEIMAYLNSDDVLAPGALRYVLSIFRDHPHVEVVYGHRIVIDEHNREVGRWTLPEHQTTDLRWADYVPQETLFWRRSLYQRVAGIDVGLRFAMDWDLLLQFAAAGAFMVRLPRFLAAFRVHSFQKTQTLNEIGETEIELLRRRYGLPHMNAAERTQAIDSILHRGRLEAANHPDCRYLAQELAWNKSVS